jgi:tRNA dimethylallyltransferase
MFEKLKRIDPEYDREIHPNNTKYVLRAIEVKLLTGKSKSEFKEEKVLSYDTLFLTPYDGERQKLYERIDKRVEGMFEEGLVDEVQNLIKIPGFI